MREHNLGNIFESQQVFPCNFIISQLKSSMAKKQQTLVKSECQNKVKLRTFIKIKDFEVLSPHIGKPLSFIERKTLSQLRLGILPLRLETARFLRPILPEEERVCYCNSGEVESELHFLFTCPKYVVLREAWLGKLSLPIDFESLDLIEHIDSYQCTRKC